MLIQSLFSFRVGENFPSWIWTKGRFKKKKNQNCRGLQLMIKVNRVPNAENLSLKLFQIKFLQLSCSNLNSERFLLLGEWKNQQSYSTFWERGSLSHLNRVCVWNLFFIIFFNRKKSTNWQLVVQIFSLKYWDVVGANYCPS